MAHEYMLQKTRTYYDWYQFESLFQSKYPLLHQDDLLDKLIGYEYVHDGYISQCWVSDLNDVHLQKAIGSLVDVNKNGVVYFEVSW